MVQSLGHGGCERDAAKLAISLDRDFFTPYVGVMRAGGFRLGEVREAGVRVEHFAVDSFLNPTVLSAARQLGAFAAQEKIAIVHAFDVPTDIFAGLAGRFYQVPKIVTAQLSFRELVSAKERLLLRATDKISDIVVVNSKAVGRSLERDYKVPREKVYLCYNGVDSSEFFPRETERPEFLRNASVVVGSVCVMRPEKRMDWLIRAFAGVQGADPQAMLLLVGSGPEKDRLEALASDVGIAGKVVFIPGQAQVADWMRTIDIYVNASVSESFPNALLEAMACGCCVVGSSVGGIPELVEDEKCGLVFDTNSLDSLMLALKRVLSDRELRQAFRERGCARAHAQFSMSNNVARMEALYRSLVN